MHNLQRLLKQFNLKGYADESAKYELQADNSKRLELKSDDYTYKDTFWGGEPYGGYEVIFENEKEKLLINYYGWVEKGEDFKAAYSILRHALKLGAEDETVLHRGLKEYTESDYKYTNEWIGDIERFELTEKMYLKDKQIYQAKFFGGLVSVETE